MEALKFGKVLSALTKAFDINARTAILQDFLSGEILYEKDPDKSIYPASMTKIMTTIIAFDLIKSGKSNKEETKTNRYLVMPEQHRTAASESQAGAGKTGTESLRAEYCARAQ